MSSSYEIKDGWDFISNFQGSAYASQVARRSIANVENAIKQIEKDMNGKMGSKESVETLKGFIAEYWHADTFNINATINQSSHRAIIERSTEMGSVDVSTNFGKDYSMKYYATGADSAKQQATNIIQAYQKYLHKSKAENPMTFEEYINKNGYPNDMQIMFSSVYCGQGRVVPTEQLEEAIKFLERKIAIESSKESVNRIALLQGYQETLKQLTDRIKDNEGVESIPLRKDEAEAIAALCKSGDFKPEDFGFTLKELITSDYILQQALQAGFTSAVITLVMQVGPQIFNTIEYLIKNEEIDIKQLKDMGLKVMSTSAESFLKGAISASLTIACQSGKFGAQFTNVSPGVIGAITVIVMDTMKNSCAVAQGKMETREMATELTKDILVSSASVATGTIGQTIFPELPVLGYMLGSFVGSIIASITINAAEKTILSICVDTGFTFFGLVDQNYELPKEVMEKMGLEVLSPDFTNVDYIEMKREKMNILQPSRTKYNTIDIMILRRGIIGVNKIGYVL